MEFNLTTVEGCKQALESLNKSGSISTLELWLFNKAFDWGLVPLPVTKTIDDQRKTAVELIKAGRDNEVDEMKITLDQTAGIDIGADVQGIPIKAKIGKNGKMTLEVKYKNS